MAVLRVSVAILLLCCASFATARRELRADTGATTPDTCASNVFFAMPTAWNGNQGYVIASTNASSDAYCKAKGFMKHGSRKDQPRWYTNLESTEPLIDLADPTHPICLDPGCNWITAIECVPEGGEPCAVDAYGNFGAGNVGWSNFGHYNVGNGNAGNNNTGDGNYGNGIVNTKFVGYPGATGPSAGFVNTQNPGIDLQGIGLLGHNLLQVFSAYGNGKINLEDTAHGSDKTDQSLTFCSRLNGYYLDTVSPEALADALQMALNQGPSYGTENIKVSSIAAPGAPAPALAPTSVPAPAPQASRRMLSIGGGSSTEVITPQYAAYFSTILRPTPDSTNANLTTAVDQLPLFFRSGFQFIDKGRVLNQGFTIIDCASGQPLGYITSRPVKACTQINVCFATGGAPSRWDNQTALLRSVVASLQKDNATSVKTKGGRLAVVRLAKNPRVLVNATRITRAANSLDFTSSILANKPSARVEVLSTGITKCQELLEGMPAGRPKRIVLLTSTNPNDVDNPNLVMAADTAKAAGIAIATVGVDNVDLNILQGLATSSDMAVQVSKEDFSTGGWLDKIDSTASKICQPQPGEGWLWDSENQMVPVAGAGGSGSTTVGV